MKQTIPINTTGGVSRTIYSHYAQAGWHDFDPASPIPHTAILEIEMEESKPIQIAQIYDQKQNPMNGRVYDVDGIAPTLRTPTGGLSEPKIMQIGSYEPMSCALRGRNPDNPSDRMAGIDTEQRLEIGSDVAICLTSVQKDSLIIEQVIGSMQANAMRGSIDGVSPCLTEAMGMGGGQIPMIVQSEHGFNKGGVFEDVAPTVTSSAYQDNNHLVEPISRQDSIAFKEMPNGDIRAYDASTPDKRGVSELQITNADNIAPTVTTSHEPKVLVKYRIRKLTPTECFRLMGVDDADIEKLKSAKLTQTLKSGKVKEKPMPKTQLYKMAGNSIVVDVLYYIFRNMFIPEYQSKPKPKIKQLTIFDYL